MTRIISFDIGIRNLAYCVFSVEKSTDKPWNAILAWDVLDISTKVDGKMEEPKPESLRPTCYCTCILANKNQKTCQKKAKYKQPNETVTGNKEYFCERHAKEAQEKKKYYLPNPEFQTPFLKKQKVDFLVEFERKYGFLNEDKKEKKEERIERIVKWVQEKVLHLLVKKTEKKKTEIGLVEIGRNMAEHLLAIPEAIQEIDTVLIENQISPIANKMKTIQGMLAQIYILHGVENIEFVSSSNKLKGFSSPSTSLLSEREKEEKYSSMPMPPSAAKTNPNPNYKQHKKDGIAFCKQLLEQRGETEWKTFFETYPKKQDDLADAFLQGIWYLNKKK